MSCMWRTKDCVPADGLVPRRGKSPCFAIADTLNSPLGTKSLAELDAAHCDSSSPEPPRNHGRPRSRTDRWRVTRDHDLAAGLPSGTVHDVRAYLSTGRS